MVSHLKSLRRPVKKTGLQLYQQDVVPLTKDLKALYQRDNHFSLVFITPPEQTNKELINLLYNDVKNFTSSLSFCIGPKFVFSNGDTKALFLCELHFSLIFTSRPLNHQQTNKQLITLMYNEFHFKLLQWCQHCTFKRKIGKHYVNEIITFLLFL